MTHRQRAAAALSLQVPDYVPTFELEFQLAPELMGGRDFLHEEQLQNLSPREVEAAIWKNAEFMLETYRILEYDILPVHYLNFEHTLALIRALRTLSGDEYMLCTHGDGTFAIPDGAGMEAFAYRLVDEPEAVHEEAEKMAADAIERNKRLVDAGLDCFILCSDYCFNNGPFLSPKMFREFVFPYLERILHETRAAGAFTIKHTDGNIMPILDQLVEAGPHALHSIDPMAGVDIRNVKKLVGDRVALCGNVHCAAMQTGTEKQVVESAEYCLTWAKPGGGYVFTTSNVPFRGLPLERYQLVLDTWKRLRWY